MFTSFVISSYPVTLQLMFWSLWSQTALKYIYMIIPLFFNQSLISEWKCVLSWKYGVHAKRKHTRNVWIPPRTSLPINTPTEDASLVGTCTMSGQQQTTHTGSHRPFGSLHTCYQINHYVFLTEEIYVFYEPNLIQWHVSLIRRLNLSGVLGQPQKKIFLKVN